VPWLVRVLMSKLARQIAAVVLVEIASALVSKQIRRR